MEAIKTKITREVKTKVDVEIDVPSVYRDGMSLTLVHSQGDRILMSKLYNWKDGSYSFSADSYGTVIDPDTMVDVSEWITEFEKFAKWVQEENDRNQQFCEYQIAQEVETVLTPM